MAEKKKKQEVLDLSACSDMEDVLQSLRERYGDNAVVLGSKAAGMAMSYVSTGSYHLDIALGGGFPQNRIIELRGPFSSFKSTIALISARRFQKKTPTGFVVYIDLEKSFDAEYAKQIGVDLDRLILVNPDSGEQSVDLLNDLMSARFDLWVILDSVAALVPSAEIEGSMDDQFMGVQARLVNRAMRVMNARLNRSIYDSAAPKTTVIALNQLREKIGVVYGNPETTPGGKGKDFFYSVIVRLQSSPSKAIHAEVTRNGVKRDVKFGQVVSFKVMKNKCGGPQHEEGEFEFYYKDYGQETAGCFNNVTALYELGVFHEVIPFTNGVFKFGPISAKRSIEFIKRLRTTMPSIRADLYRQIIKKVNPKFTPNK